MPCADNAFANSPEKTKNAMAKHSSPQDHQDEDNCSPFCTCACCASGFNFSFLPYRINCAEFSGELNFVEHSSLKVCKISSAIWQPPKIS